MSAPISRKGIEGINIAQKNTTGSISDLHPRILRLAVISLNLLCNALNNELWAKIEPILKAFRVDAELLSIYRMTP